MRQRLAVALTVLACAWGMASGPEALGPARLESVLPLPRDPKDLGGFSAVELGVDGMNAILITDRGHILRGNFIRENSILVGAHFDPIVTLRDMQGIRVRKKGNDSEAAALRPDGTLFVSFEGKDRILSFAPGADTAQARLTSAYFTRFPKNGGLEALAIAPDGALYALPERTWTRRRETPLLRGTDQGWQALPGYRRSQGFVPVGADFGPDQRLYILERHFKGLGFASRVRSYAVDRHGLRDPRVILQTPQRRHGNLEGLSVWQDPNGNLRLTMVSDDNFLSLLPSEIVEYVLPKSLANKGTTD